MCRVEVLSESLDPGAKEESSASSLAAFACKPKDDPRGFPRPAVSPRLLAEYGSIVVATFGRFLGLVHPRSFVADVGVRERICSFCETDRWGVVVVVVVVVGFCGTTTRFRDRDCCCRPSSIRGLGFVWYARDFVIVAVGEDCNLRCERGLSVDAFQVALASDCTCSWNELFFTGLLISRRLVGIRIRLVNLVVGFGVTSSLSERAGSECCARVSTEHFRFLDKPMTQKSGRGCKSTRAERFDFEFSARDIVTVTGDFSGC